MYYAEFYVLFLFKTCRAVALFIPVPMTNALPKDVRKTTASLGEKDS
jgi:hypothetical protein